MVWGCYGSGMVWKRQEPYFKLVSLVWDNGEMILGFSISAPVFLQTSRRVPNFPWQGACRTFQILRLPPSRAEWPWRLRCGMPSCCVLQSWRGPAATSKSGGWIQSVMDNELLFWVFLYLYTKKKLIECLYQIICYKSLFMICSSTQSNL